MFPGTIKLRTHSFDSTHYLVSSDSQSFGDHMLQIRKLYIQGKDLIRE